MSAHAVIYKRSAKVALIVGSLLALINYGDKLYLGTMTSTDWIKLALTYCVPFAVASYAGLSALNSTDKK